MTCRCATTAEHEARYQATLNRGAQSEATRAKKEIAKLKEEIAGLTLKADHYKVLEVRPAGDNQQHLVMKVAYPSCEDCVYEGVKVIVFRDTTALDAVKWTRIDPHFRDPEVAWGPEEAPSPTARFPATAEGWEDALDFAKELI